MTGPGNQVGVRNKLPANKEHRGLDHRYLVDDYASMTQGLGKMTVGRFLLSKVQVKAGEEKVENSILDARKSLADMNKSRGVAVDIGSIMITYQTPEEFQARILTRVRNDKEERRLTARGLKQHIYDVKNSIATTFRAQSVEAFRMQDAQMRPEEQQERLRFEDTQKDNPIYADLIPVELEEEFEDAIMIFNETAPSGFKFTQKIHYVDDLVGLRVRQQDEVSASLLQNDIDRINAAYGAHGLLSDEHPEVRLGGAPLFVPLFRLTMNPDQAKDELYLPYITRTAVPFQELGIHKIQ